MEHPMLGFLNERERFIPVQVPTLLARMLADPRLSNQEREQLAWLAEMLQARIHFEFLELGEQLRALYDVFNPDRDTLPLCGVAAPRQPAGPAEVQPNPQRDAQFRQLREGIEFLLNKNNYTKLTPKQLAVCIQSKSRWGLAVKIDPQQYHQIDVYYRGVRKEIRQECSWRTWWQPLDRSVWVFSRVAVLVRQTGPPYGDRVLLKLFKEIVIEDLKMTWPNLRILMRPVDQLTIAAGALGSIFTPLWKLLVAVTLSPYLVATVVFGCISAMVRAIWGFFSCKEYYVKTLTHNLYYQNLANNLSALASLIETAEAEELKEALLAYYLLYTERDRSYTSEELDRRIEQWLAEQFSLDRVDFEIEDALGKLVAKKLAVVQGRKSPSRSSVPEGETQAPAEESSSAAGEAKEVATRQTWRVYDLPTALRRLDQWWDERFPYYRG